MPCPTIPPSAAPNIIGLDFLIVSIKAKLDNPKTAPIPLETPN